MSNETSVSRNRGNALTRNASDVATEMIRDAIFDGRLAPGRRLKEVQLAQDLGISRTPVREALLLLQAEGLVDSTPNRGAIVRAYTSAELVDMYDLRALLESHAARRAATRITDEQLALLDESCAQFRAYRVAHDLPGLTKENLFFHFTIVDVAGAPKLAELVHGAVQLPLVYRSFYWYSRSEIRLSEDFHRRIVSALRARDAERTELLMKEHIYEGRDHLVANIERTAGAAPDGHDD